MADFVIKPASDPDWGNARFLSGPLPLNAVDAAALGIAMGTDYEIGRLGALATFQVSDVPAAMAAPSLTPGATQVDVTLPADPADGGQSILQRDLRHRISGGSWTLVTDVSDPIALTGFAEGTTVEVQVRAVNGNGNGPWSPTASATTTTTVSGDTIAPVINSASYAGSTLTIGLTEASGAASAVWASHDPGATPTFTVAGGWSGTVYETGNFDVASGGDTDTISISTATPDGARELTLYFYDEADNLSAAERVAVTVSNTSQSQSIAVAQQVADLIHDSSQNAFPYESNSIAIGSGSDRLLVAAIALNATTNGVDLSDMQADFGAAGRTFGTGTSMTLIGPSNTNGRKPQIAFALLAAPSGSGTVMFNSAAGTVTAGQVRLYEFTGANQSVAAHTPFTADGTTGATELSTSGTAVDGCLVSVLAVDRGDYTGEITANGATTLDATALGGSGIAGISVGFASAPVAAGATGDGFTWTTTRAAELITLNIASA
ncbi:hypothetical protein [Gymnodinialimonas ulvae]|uniref:hypothetical protein n=1 Tax=Gymnodinialimonas ulvae TaxID=3126504 RepID=UPI0030B4BF34